MASSHHSLDSLAPPPPTTGDGTGETTTHPCSAPAFVGRQTELALLAARLRDHDVRLLTLTGPAGIGKTRLALEAATTLAPEFPGGVVVVPLGTVIDAPLVMPSVASALGLADDGTLPLVAQIASALPSRSALLLLDNLDHLAGAGPALLDLLGRAAHLTILGTSAAPLGVDGEVELVVPPLAPADAVALFVQQARHADPGFVLTDDTEPLVDGICRDLDGLPFAIELAARQLRSLSLATLRPRFARYSRPARSGDNQPVRGAIAWSYGRLHPDHQRLLRQLAVFRGGIALPVAEAVCAIGSADPTAADDPGRRVDVAAGIAELLQRNLLVTEIDGAGLPRYAMPPTIRAFGLEQLALRDERDAVYARFVAYWQAQAEATWRESAEIERLSDVLARLDPEHDNLRAALDWLEQHDAPGAVALAGALFWFWYVRGHYSEALRRLLPALERAPAGPTSRSLARARLAAGTLAHFRTQPALATHLLHQALADWTSLHDAWGIGYAHLILGIIAEDAGDLAASRQHQETAITHLEQAGDLASSHAAQYHLAIVALAGGDRHEARALLDRVLGGYPKTRYRTTFWSLHLRGLLAHVDGDADAALADELESLRHFDRVGFAGGIVAALAGVATVAADCDPAAAVRLWAAAEAMAGRRGETFHDPELALYRAAVARMRDRLGEEAFARGVAKGRRWSVREAVNLALALDPPPSS